MKIALVPIDELIPYDRNPRYNDRAVDAVARSIEEFGFRQPIDVDERGVIIVGHTRWKAALKLELKTVPVRVASELTPEQIPYRYGKGASRVVKRRRVWAGMHSVDVM